MYSFKECLYFVKIAVSSEARIVKVIFYDEKFGLVPLNIFVFTTLYELHHIVLSSR